MWCRQILVLVVVCAAALGCGKKANNAAGAGGVGGAFGAGGAFTGTGGSTIGTGTGTGGTPAAAMCPAVTVTSCGGAACTAPSSTVAAAPLCIQVCCTADNKCGKHNAAMNGACTADPLPGMCPQASVIGTMVPGCCTSDGKACGIVDIAGLGGMVNSCVARASVPLANLPPVNCDGTMPMGTAGMGAAGMGAAGHGTGGMGTAGMGTAGHGTGGMGTGGMGTGGMTTGGTGGH